MKNLYKLLITSCVLSIFFFLENGSSDVILKKGEIVKVVSSSQTRGCLVVEHKGKQVHVPFQVMELKVK